MFLALCLFYVIFVCVLCLEIKALKDNVALCTPYDSILFACKCDIVFVLPYLTNKIVYNMLYFDVMFITYKLSCHTFIMHIQDKINSFSV